MKWSKTLMALLASPAAARRLMSPDKCPNLEWSDEFDDPSTFDERWSHQNGDGCDISLDLCGWGNSEWQWYQAENTAFVNNTLVMKADFDGDRFTSSRLHTKGKVAIDMSKPYYVEARLKIADGQGIWPAFWMLPDNFNERQWPAGGEIDIMEYIGREPHLAHGYIHYGDHWNDKSKKGGPLRFPDSPPDQYRTYAIEKTPNQITYLIDGHRFQTFSKDDIEGKFSWPFERPFYFLLNIAIGGGWPGNPDNTTIFPTTMNVDYIRVYDIANGNFGAIEGTGLVHAGDENVTYCLASDSIEYTDLVWSTPDGSSVSPRPSKKCAVVSFGSESGYVQVAAKSGCGDRVFRMPVEVQPYFYVESTLVGPADNDRAEIVRSIGDYQIGEVDGKAVAQYRRNIDQLYDYVMYAADIADPAAFVAGKKKFYMNVIAPTVASCTEVIVNLEDSTKATEGNWPVGRHSRYTALIENRGDGWERLEFRYEDRPDPSTMKVDRVAVLFNPNLVRGDEYLMSNFDIASPNGKGSGRDFEPLSTNQCRAKVKSEAGACNDGINNDGPGFDGEPGGPMDCEDADCWDDPVCQIDLDSERGFCNDGIDQDGDGLIDCQDPDCLDDPACQVAGVASVLCEENANCAALGLSGVCCPTKEGVSLFCCNQL